jgi:hypothetical protein
MIQTFRESPEPDKIKIYRLMAQERKKRVPVSESKVLVVKEDSSRKFNSVSDEKFSYT